MKKLRVKKKQSVIGRIRKAIGILAGSYESASDNRIYKNSFKNALDNTADEAIQGSIEETVFVDSVV